MHFAAYLDEALPDLLSQPMQVLAQLQRRAESLRSELAWLKKHVALDTPHLTAPVIQIRGDETILIADDHALIRSIAAEILVEFGYRVLLANGNLIDAPACRVIDLMMLDVPLLDAEHLCRVERAKEHAARAKLIVCTLLPEGPARNQLRVIGVDDFVSKPYQPFVLATSIRRVLDLSRQQK